LKNTALKIRAINDFEKDEIKRLAGEEYLIRK